jgi:hypothetical protein
MFAPPPEIRAEVFACLPDAFRERGRASRWGDEQQRVAPTDSFLESPSFDIVAGEQAGARWLHPRAQRRCRRRHDQGVRQAPGRLLTQEDDPRRTDQSGSAGQVSQCSQSIPIAITTV